MVDVSTEELRKILIGTELGGRVELAYRVSFAVPNSQLGIERDGNSSGFSFGVVQLDIANNSFASNAYDRILAAARDAGDISDDEFQQYSQYNRLQRPDLDPGLSTRYRDDQSVLTEQVFSRDYARSIIDDATRAYIEQSLRGSVNSFLAAMEDAWGSETVFTANNPDFALALTAMVSISNRTGGLGGSTRHFVRTRPASLVEVRARYDSVLGDHWHLIEVGAQTMTA